MVNQITISAVRLTADDKLIIIDQTLLPGELSEIEIKGKEQLIAAIARLSVRGAPAIGMAAAYGLYLAARKYAALPRAEFDCRLRADAAEIDATRPTAVNLHCALSRMLAVADTNPELSAADLLPLLRAEACALAANEDMISVRIAQLGCELIHDGDGVITHCNAGALAAGGMGTALAPLYLAHEQGRRFTVYCDETRPLLQGARLTAWELLRAGLDTVLLCDNMAASLMAAGKVHSVFIGADRVAANGDTANKIGTLSLAVNARHFNIPFYVCAPTTTLDTATVSGKDIVIEQRPAAEVSTMWFARPMAPSGVKVYNPAFDVTPAKLITAIITERGLFRYPYSFGKQV
jgi:methylthioribose-1-phosphate isomerase